MRSFLKLTAATGAAAAACAFFPAVANASASGGVRAGTFASAHTRFTDHTVFVQNDSVSGNQVITYERTARGGLVETGAYATGGIGGVLGGSVVDHLASEGSVAYDAAAKLLYAVNAGSDSVTVFAVDDGRLERLQVIGSGGSFPVSIAVRGPLVYVLNARAGGSISGFLRVGERLVAIPGWHRGLGLNPNQTPEFTSTPGQLSFSPDGSHLVVTTKNGGNSILVYRVGLFGPSERPAVTSTPGGVPFGFAFDAYGHLEVTEAATSTVAGFALARGGGLTALGSAPTGQKATCWAVADGNVLYVSNAASGTISAYRTDADGNLTSLGNTATDAGTVDAAVSADGKFLYVEAGAKGIVDAYSISPSGALTPTGSVAIPNGAGAEGIVAD